MNEIIFEFADAPEGGYTARALGASIFTEADSLPRLREEVRDAVRCHFEEGGQPVAIRLRYVREELKGDATAWAKHFVGRGLVALEAEASHTASTYLVGETVTLADCCLVPQLYACRRFGVPLDACPTLLRVEKNLQALDAYQRSRPEAQPDAQP